MNYEQELEKERARHAARMSELQAQREAEEAQFSERMAALMEQRDAEALKKKLEGYPKKLIETHKNCTCGAEMRPFASADSEGRIQKFWACSAGNLSPDHDLIKV